MIYADAKMREEYQQLPAPLRGKLEDLDAWLKAQNWPELFISQIGLTDADSERIYGPVAERLVRALELNGLKGDREKALAGTLKNMSPERRLEWARTRFSWLRFLCGVQVRNRVYSRQQRHALMNRLRLGTNGTQWEIEEQELGRPDYLSVAYKDFGQRKRLMG